ncbi:hypothetical protein SAMN02745157_2521 [Kaistia soli DSM 19436]|uniref:DUF2783 domain-containing protein n=1 Tax=Kaistia soli DSM 19436 TaxID=1122133 RepID=A0A1M5D094_9HYPH|nr:hypothetical protein [Kaistia soli]SHF60401.1 hypothetical protein SAMN02745157_2521 [Kaistia soli DSM 19436]
MNDPLSPAEYDLHSVSTVERQLAESLADAIEAARNAGMPDPALRQALLDLAVAISNDNLDAAVMLAAVRAERRRREANRL